MAETPFDEAEAVAMDICRYIASGGRYRDITVVLRDVGRYTGILDVTFEKYGIPCYMSKRTSVVSKPFFRYLHHLFVQPELKHKVHTVLRVSYIIKLIFRLSFLIKEQTISPLIHLCERRRIPFSRLC